MLLGLCELAATSATTASSSKHNMTAILIVRPPAALPQPRSGGGIDRAQLGHLPSLFSSAARGGQTDADADVDVA